MSGIGAITGAFGRRESGGGYEKNEINDVENGIRYHSEAFSCPSQVRRVVVELPPRDEPENTVSAQTIRDEYFVTLVENRVRISV